MNIINYQFHFIFSKNFPPKVSPCSKMYWLLSKPNVQLSSWYLIILKLGVPFFICYIEAHISWTPCLSFLPCFVITCIRNKMLDTLQVWIWPYYHPSHRWLSFATYRILLESYFPQNFKGPPPWSSSFHIVDGNVWNFVPKSLYVTCF